MKQQKLKHKIKLSPFDIILEPVLTEKAVGILNESKNKKKYTFKVHQSASKIDIKQTIEDIFNVKVDQVNVIKIPSKTKYFRYRYKFTKSSYKKAIVTLKEGFSIKEIDSSIEKQK